MMDRMVAIETKVQTLENELQDMKVNFSDFGTRVQCKVGFQGPNCETCADGYFNFPNCTGK